MYREPVPAPFSLLGTLYLPKRYQILQTYFTSRPWSFPLSISPRRSLHSPHSPPHSQLRSEACFTTEFTASWLSRMDCTYKQDAWSRRLTSSVCTRSVSHDEFSPLFCKFSLMYPCIFFQLRSF
jgi:hypothetical protein